MKLPETPEELTALSDDDLHALAAEIQSTAEAMRDQAGSDDDALAQLEGLAGQYQLLIDELAAREEAAQVRQERVQAALTSIGAPSTADEGDETDGDIEAEAEQVAAVATELATTEAATLADDDEGGSTIPQDPATGRVPSEPEADAGAPSDDTTEEDQEAAVADTDTNEDAGLATGDDAVARLAANRPRHAAIPARPEMPSRPMTRRSGPRSEVSRFVDNGLVEANGKGKDIDRARLAELICKKHGQLARMSTTVSYEPITLASAKHEEFEFQLNSGHEENFSVIRAAVERGKALVASGGNCAPLAPNWDVFNVAEPMGPVENFLASIGATRGGIRYVQPPLWPEAQAGVRFTTNDEDADGYTNQDPAGTTAPKPCVHLECRPIVECQVDAVSQCVTFGNLQYRTFPEQVEVFLEHLAVAFAQAKEVNYIDAIDAGSTAVNASPAYGATRGSVFAWALAAHAYRKRNHMPLDAPLDVLAPDTMLPLIKADMVNDLHLGLSFLDVEPGTVARELFDRMNLNVEFYYDFSTAYGAVNALQQAQAAGGLNPFPSVYRNYMFAPGTWIRLDGGTLDVGIVRDSTLNSQNDLQIFSEEFVQVCKVGIESIRLDLTLCPSGVGPAPETALICAS